MRDKKVFIMSLPRTRSTYLQDVILHYNSPELKKSWLYPYFSEPFNTGLKYHRDNIKLSYEWVCETPDAVIKTHSSHIASARNNQYAQKYFDDFQWFMIKLFRRNIVDQAISFARSEITDTWTTVTPEVINIPIPQFAHAMKRMYNWIDMSLNVLYEIRPNHIMFMEDMTDPMSDFMSLNIHNDHDFDKTRLTHYHNGRYKPQLPKNKTVANLDELYDYATRIPVPTINGLKIDSNHYIQDVEYDKYIYIRT